MIKVYEKRPPRILAVEYDGYNSAELLEIIHGSTTIRLLQDVIAPNNQIVIVQGDTRKTIVPGEILAYNNESDNFQVYSSATFYSHYVEVVEDNDTELQEETGDN